MLSAALKLCLGKNLFLVQHLIGANGKCAERLHQSVGLLRELVAMLLFLLPGDQIQLVFDFVKVAKERPDRKKKKDS